MCAEENGIYEPGEQSLATGHICVRVRQHTCCSTGSAADSAKCANFRHESVVTVFEKTENILEPGVFYSRISWWCCVKKFGMVELK